MAKKSYNPFKMWGSWVGAGYALITYVFAFLVMVIAMGNSGEDVTIPLKIASILYYPASLIAKLYFFMGITGGLILMILTVITSFFIGWGIHSLFRALSGNKSIHKFFED